MDEKQTLKNCQIDINILNQKQERGVMSKLWRNIPSIKQ